MAKKFIRKDTHKKKRLPLVWRKPKGITNKIRLQRKGHSIKVKPGFGTKDSERGKTSKGLMIIEVSSMEQLKKINPKTQAALIMGLGKRKKMEIVNEAEKLKISMVNFNAKSYKERAEKFLTEKKQESKQKKAEKIEVEASEAKANDAKKATAKNADEEKTPEQKKKEEKEEKDKVLIGKQ